MNIPRYYPSIFCITTVVNKEYQKYIPLFCYFINKSYPDYDIVLVLTEKLTPKYAPIIDKLNKTRKSIHVLEKQFNDFPKYNQALKTLRWFLPQLDIYNNYDYVYVGDIDILICKEDIGLLEKHINHCKQQQLCYSNKVRKTKLKRLTGLHFYKVKEYNEKILPVVEEYKKMLLKNSQSLVKEIIFGNEHVLYNMVKKAGLGFPKDNFRPHHGIHLGMWRKPNTKISKEKWSGIGGKNIYLNYYNFYKQFKNDKLYNRIVSIAPLQEIKQMEKCMGNI